MAPSPTCRQQVADTPVSWPAIAQQLVDAARADGGERVGAHRLVAGLTEAVLETIEPAAAEGRRRLWLMVLSKVEVAELATAGGAGLEEKAFYMLVDGAGREHEPFGDATVGEAPADE
jgi:hypothetical protein